MKIASACCSKGWQQHTYKKLGVQSMVTVAIVTLGLPTTLGQPKAEQDMVCVWELYDFSELK